MVVVLVFVWGGFALFVTAAVKREKKKAAESLERAIQLASDNLGGLSHAFDRKRTDGGGGTGRVSAPCLWRGD